jgi:hypothetical protein
MIMTDPEDLVGKWVRVMRCQALTHDSAEKACVCGLVGREVRLGRRYGGRMMRYEQPAYHVRRRPEIVLRNELAELPQPPTFFRRFVDALKRVAPAQFAALS